MTANLERLKALALAATPGPWAWKVNEEDSDHLPQLWGPDTHNQFVCSFGRNHSYDIEAGLEPEPNDMAFIAAANPAAVLDLLAQLERATAQNKALVDERNALIIERNRALVQAIKAEQKLTRIRGLSEIGTCECDQIAEIAKSSSDPNDPLDDALPLWPRVTRIVTRHSLDDVLPLAEDAVMDELVELGKQRGYNAQWARNVLERRRLPLNLPASLDLPDTEGGSLD